MAKAIYPEWNGDLDFNKDDLISLYNNFYKEPTITEESVREILKYRYPKRKPDEKDLKDISFAIYSADTAPYFSNFQNLSLDPNVISTEHKGTGKFLYDYFPTLDPTKQYFPTLEFPVGKNYCCVDCKKFMLEAPIVKNKEGRVLIPTGHLSTILTSSDNPTMMIDIDKNPYYLSAFFSLESPIGSKKRMGLVYSKSKDDREVELKIYSKYAY